jgi:peptide-methionine (S)-S-oxide reductase
MENQKGIQEGLEIATLAGGCFCVQKQFSWIRGSTCCYFWLYWGKTIDPTYKEICNGDTGHAEAIEITRSLKSDSRSFGDLLQHTIRLR